MDNEFQYVLELGFRIYAIVLMFYLLVSNPVSATQVPLANELFYVETFGCDFFFRTIKSWSIELFNIIRLWQFLGFSSFFNFFYFFQFYIQFSIIREEFGRLSLLKSFDFVLIHLFYYYLVHNNRRMTHWTWRKVSGESFV